MTKRSPFQRALVAAEKRLGKAIEERDKASKRVTDLEAEIPHLRATIYALERQLNPADINVEKYPVEVTVTHRNSQTGQETPPSPIPADVASRVKAATEPFVGVGSIPAVKGPEVPELSEDELLKDEL
jgi:chromosome segregation ATPase